jgi:hypothetical protein
MSPIALVVTGHLLGQQQFVPLIALDEALSHLPSWRYWFIPTPVGNVWLAVA